MALTCLLTLWRRVPATLFLMATLSHAAETAPRLRLPPIFGDNVVLQPGDSTPVWGWVPPGAEVTASFAGQTASAKAGADGIFRTDNWPVGWGKY